MKMGIREFRERLSEVALGDEVVILTHHGKRVGRYLPEHRRGARNIDLDAWVSERETSGRRWRAVTPDWRERLAALGIPEDEIAGLDADDRCS